MTSLPLRLGRAAAIAALLASLACSTQGKRFDADSVPRIHPGETTHEQVRKIFGDPVRTRTSYSGRAEWRYSFSETRTVDTGLFARIGQFIARLFGVWTPGSPVNVAWETTATYRLTVYFDPDGVVEDYTYDRSETPRKRVY